MSGKIIKLSFQMDRNKSNPIAKSLSDNSYRKRIVKSKLTYSRKRGKCSILTMDSI